MHGLHGVFTFFLGLSMGTGHHASERCALRRLVVRDEVLHHLRSLTNLRAPPGSRELLMAVACGGGGDVLTIRRERKSLQTCGSARECSRCPITLWGIEVLGGYKTLSLENSTPGFNLPGYISGMPGSIPNNSVAYTPTKVVTSNQVHFLNQVRSLEWSECMPLFQKID